MAETEQYTPKHEHTHRNSTERGRLVGRLAMGESTAETSPNNTDLQEFRNRLQENFAPFSDEVSRIKELLKTTPPQHIQGYLAAGNESLVFSYAHEGKQYAIRVSQISDAAEHIDDYVTSMAPGQGIEGLEQLVGVSYEEGVSISELLPGKGAEKLSAAELAAVPDAHYQKLADTLLAAAQAGIGIDPNDGNVLYDPEVGFSIVDYGAASTESARNIAHTVTDALFRPGYWLRSGELPLSEFAQDYDVLKEVTGHFAAVYERWLSILDAKQRELGLGSNYLSRLDEVFADAQHFAAAHQLLMQDGTTGNLMAAAQYNRFRRLENLDTQARNAPNEMIRQNILQRKQKVQQPLPLFAKGTVRTSRNDNR